MKIDTYRWDQVPVSDLARVTHAARQREVEQGSITSEGLDEMFRQECETITLGTDVNMRAFDLYRKYGFEVVSGSTVYRWRKPRPS